MSFTKSQLEEIYNFLINDFQSLWDALASIPDGENKNGGNYIFALQTMILLEFACRVCVGNNSLFNIFIGKLRSINPKYFTNLPGDLTYINRSRESTIVPKPRDFNSLPIQNYSKELLWVIYDVVRNGHAHQYDQTLVKLTNGELIIGVTGAEHELFLRNPVKKVRKENHLSLKNNIELVVHTHRLFLDIEKAIKDSKLISSYNGDFKSMTDREIHCSTKDIRNTLIQFGHDEYKQVVKPPS